MFRHPLPLATSNLRGVHSRKQPRAGKRSSKTRNRQGELTRSEGGRLVPIQTSTPPKNELGQRHREPPNPPRNLPTLQTPNQHISTTPTEGQRRAANSDMGAGGLLGRKKGPAGTRRAARAKPRGSSDGSGGPKGRAGGATGPISAPAPSVNSPYRLPDRPFGLPQPFPGPPSAPPFGLPVSVLTLAVLPPQTPPSPRGSRAPSSRVSSEIL
jgi:hypothetical protein